MPSSNVLQEFIVKLGLTTDENQLRRFNENMRGIAAGAAGLIKNFVKLGEASVVSLGAAGLALHSVAKGMESMYFASQRTGASVRELDAFSFGLSQVGGTAEQARGAVESLAAARRTNPGVNGLLGGLGIDPRQTDNVRVLTQLLVRLHAMPYFQGAQLASKFGIDEQTFNQAEINLPRMLKFIALRDKMIGDSGVDPDAMAKKAEEFDRRFDALETRMKNLGLVIATRLMPQAEKVMIWLERVVNWISRADAKTDGWATKLLGLAVAVKAFSASLSVLGKLSGLRGISQLFAGGAATVTAEAAEAGGIAASAEAGGVVAGIAWPVAIAAAAVAAMAWVDEHPEIVRKFAKQAWDWTKSEAGQVTKAVANAMTAPVDPKHKITDRYHSGLAPNSFGFTGGINMAGGLLGFVQRAEGFVSKLYEDHKGLSIGFGHHLQPGEAMTQVSKPEALKLLNKDLGAALASVHKLVKVQLNRNQEVALADFVFNIGAGAFAKSTLLKDINNRDFNGAAGEFSHWNKVLQNGHYVVDQGLVNRRAQEAGLFRTPDKAVSISQKTDIHVHGGASDSTARKIADQQGRVNGDMVRNFQGAVR